jgi:nitroimidazol reductase NimA-like FMN-containing flavoprotein (pyridoxamine 5'-phosphate oxidase superfamily)
MRRAFSQVTDVAILEEWLTAASVGRLATIDEQGYPVIKPVNYVYADGRVYFHSATEGEKLDDIRRDDRVGFQTERVFAVTPAPGRGCQGHCFYQCIIIRGRARILDRPEDAAEKERALRLVIAKYAPGLEAGPLDNVDKTAVVAIKIEEMTGKEDLGQRWSPEQKLKVAKLLYARDGESAVEVIERMGLTRAQVEEET